MRHDGGQGSIRMTDDEIFNLFSLKSKAVERELCV